MGAQIGGKGGGWKKQSTLLEKGRKGGNQPTSAKRGRLFCRLNPIKGGRRGCSFRSQGEKERNANSWGKEKEESLGGA